MLGINTGTYNENGWVDVQVNFNGVPATLKPLAVRPFSRNLEAVDLLGRAVDASARVLTASDKDGALRLDWNGR